MKNKKGFTLIELLAVIVILAVIALILTPIVSGIIKTAKKNAFESTGYGILESTKLYYSKQVGDLSSDLTFTCNNDTCTGGEEKLEFKGNINGSGTVLLFKDGNIALCLESSDYATLKNVGDERLSTTENGSCEFDEETKEYSVNASVSAKLYEELQDQYTLLNNTYMNGKNVLAEAITSMGVETNSDLTLEEMAENVTNISTGNPNLRYDEESGYIQAKNEQDEWVNVYSAGNLPLSDILYIYNNGVQKYALSDDYGYSDWHKNGSVNFYDNYFNMTVSNSATGTFGVGLSTTFDFTNWNYINIKLVDGTMYKFATGNPSNAFFGISLTYNSYNKVYGYQMYVGSTKNSYTCTKYGSLNIGTNTLNISEIYLTKE